MLWIAPSEKATNNAALVFSLSASDGERVGVRCQIRSLPVNNAGQNATRDTDRMQRQIQNLRRTRDLLLPRLLSGQVELKTEAA